MTHPKVETAFYANLANGFVILLLTSVVLLEAFQLPSERISGFQSSIRRLGGSFARLSEDPKSFLLEPNNHPQNARLLESSIPYSSE
jgi:hypothetical protein